MSVARIHWVSGPVLRARAEGSFHLREAVHIGARGLLGEVVRIQGDDIAVQVYEDTTGLRPGDTVRGSGLPLAGRLGPGLLGGIFDGLLRPLTGLAASHVVPGMRDAHARFYFEPIVAPRARLAAGQPFGTARSAAGLLQRCLLPPDVEGECLTVTPAGEYDDAAPVCQVRGAEERVHDVAMSHVWPVRDRKSVV